jgi:predicted phosphate transport protein (TIGR00153 family)
MLESSAHNSVEIATALKDLVDNWGDVEKKVAHIAELEHRGDSVTHEVIAQLHQTFITPFDREDIAQLAQRLDDVDDLIYAAGNAIRIYKLKEATPRAREMASIILEAAHELERAMPKLRQKGQLKHVLPHCVELNRLENKADQAYRAALGELFDDTTDMAYIVKWREIYQHMESVADRCEDVANVLEGVALKHA